MSKNPKACVIVYDTGEYSDWRRQVVCVDLRPRKMVDADVNAANVVVSDGWSSVRQVDSNYFASEDADHDKWQARRKRVQSPFRKRLLPLVGSFARHVDFADDGTFHCMEVPCG